MGEPNDTLDLWDYRNRVAAIYRKVREGGAGEPAWKQWRAERDELFASHSQTPIDPEDLAEFAGLQYFPYDPSWRLEANVLPVEGEELAVGHSGEGFTAFRRFGRVEFEVDDQAVALCLYWLDAYGGGVFLPFRDETAGEETYWGGRYLLDTVKGADLGLDGRQILLDFNYAYHPSCVYSYRWSCPLAPPENEVAIPIQVGERL